MHLDTLETIDSPEQQKTFLEILEEQDKYLASIINKDTLKKVLEYDLSLIENTPEIRFGESFLINIEHIVDTLVSTIEIELTPEGLMSYQILITQALHEYLHLDSLTETVPIMKAFQNRFNKLLGESNKIN